MSDKISPFIKMLLSKPRGRSNPCHFLLLTSKGGSAFVQGRLIYKSSVRLSQPCLRPLQMEKGQPPFPTGNQYCHWRKRIFQTFAPQSQRGSKHIFTFLSSRLHAYGRIPKLTPWTSPAGTKNTNCNHTFFFLQGMEIGLGPVS